ncbi:MAG: acylneuraminate cytidylyltransferase family protein [Lachnospiraceae bacterium]|nr:acylneuraminate cytidylyltransferase family protein [Lachnospiraceae bacterium]
MRNIAIIPARSGSKGLKDKNIKELCGKPLLAYSIATAKESGVFEHIMVSTDSEVYASIAQKWGAEVPFLRSEATSSDTASTWDTVKEVLDNYALIGEKFDSVCVLQPTSPLRTAKDIVSGYELFHQKKANAVVAVCEMEHSPLFSNTLPEDCCMDQFISQEYFATPRQSLPVYYRINGALYIVKESYLRKMDNLYQRKCYAYVMPRESSIDIDTEYDFMMTELILGRSVNKNKNFSQ